MDKKYSRATRRAVLGATGITALSGCLWLDESGSDDSGGNGGSQNGSNETSGNGNSSGGSSEDESAQQLDVSWNLLGSPIEQFKTADHWSAVKEERVELDDGSATDASPPPLTGETSLLVEGEGITQVHGNFRSEPMDISDSNISIGLLPEKPEQSSSFIFWAFDPEGNRASFRGIYPGSLDGGWIRLDLRQADTDPGFDPTYVTEYRLRVSADGPCRFWADDIRATPKPDRGKAMLIFDDILASQYDNGFELLQKHELRAAYAVVVDEVNRRHRMTGRELNEVEDAGCELICHGMTDRRLAGLSPEEQRTELLDSKEWIENHANNPEPASHFVYPRSAYDRETLKIVDEHFDMAYASGGPSAAAITDPRTVVRVDWEGFDIDELRGIVDETASNRDFLCFYFHDVEGESVQKLDELLGHLKEADLDVTVPSEFAALQSEFESA